MGWLVKTQMLAKIKQKREYNYALILIYGILMFIGGIASSVAYESYIQLSF